MDIENLVLIRNVLATSEGGLLITYLSDLATDYALKDFDEKELKGFMRAIGELKRVPSKVESIYKQK